MDAFNTKEERKELWESLVTHSMRCTRPWVVLGDFKSVLKPEDTRRGNSVTWLKVIDFHNLLKNVDYWNYLLKEIGIPGIINMRIKRYFQKLIGYSLMGIGWTQCQHVGHYSYHKA